MDKQTLKKANELDHRIDNCEKTLGEIMRIVNGPRILGIARPTATGSVKVETASSVYEIHNVGPDNFADLLWDKIVKEIVEYAQVITDELAELKNELEKL